MTKPPPLTRIHGKLASELLPGAGADVDVAIGEEDIDAIYAAAHGLRHQELEQDDYDTGYAEQIRRERSEAAAKDRTP